MIKGLYQLPGKEYTHRRLWYTHGGGILWDTGETRKVYSYFQGGYSRLEKINTYTNTVTAYIYIYYVYTIHIL